VTSSGHVATCDNCVLGREVEEKSGGEERRRRAEEKSGGEERRSRAATAQSYNDTFTVSNTSSRDLKHT
jgi:hypothetical protein